MSTPPGDSKPLSVLVFGAHPDDCDLRYGGAAVLHRQHGHRVRFVSMTNGDCGHYSEGGGVLAQRRYAEAQAAAAVADIEYQILDIHDGELEPDVALRKMVIQIMREVQADLVLCHRPWDYHPDHQAVGVVVQDAVFTVTVPNIVPLSKALRKPPVLGYLYDTFIDPTPYRATVAIDIGPVMESKIDMVHCHTSQMYEWLPYLGGTLDQVPASDAERRTTLCHNLQKRGSLQAEACREALHDCYGPQQGELVQYAESVMFSAYGLSIGRDQWARYFPFIPAVSR